MIGERVKKSGQDQAEQRTWQGAHLLHCAIRATQAREYALFLEDLETGAMISEAMVRMHSPVFFVPTSATHWVRLLTADKQHVGGVPILYPRDFVEPDLFATEDPSLD